MKKTLAALLLALGPLAAHADQARTIRLGPSEIPVIRAKVRFTTLIELPPGEKALEAITGDPDFWKVEGRDTPDRYVYCKPAKEGTSTNLQIITDKDHIYSFVLQEVSQRRGEEPDLKVIVQPTDESLVKSLAGAVKLVPAGEAEEARRALAEVARDAQRQAEALRLELPTHLRFDYTFERGKDKDPFQLRSVYRDDHFTYLQVEGEEMPALYEIKDGQPSLVQYQRRGGTYVVPKVIENGYLTIGKTKVAFSRNR